MDMIRSTKYPNEPKANDPKQVLNRALLPNPNKKENIPVDQYYIMALLQWAIWEA